MTTSGNKSIQLFIPNFKAMCTGLYAYSKRFVKACTYTVARVIDQLFVSNHVNFQVISATESNFTII